MKATKLTYRSALMCGLAGAITSLASTSAMAADEEGITELDEVVVTGVARPVNRLESSVSTSSIDIGDIDSLAPRSTQELLRSIPGIRSESSGGEGNANITVRGIPLATGGSKYVQLQEDGLPVLQFGDLNFANVDNFVRADWSVARIESIRGGSASTFTSLAPGAIVNFISNDGSKEGGAVGLTTGLDYRLHRIDFFDGGALNDKWSYAVGGFYHTGEGLRHTGYEFENGSQIKVTLTKKIEGGYFKLHFKNLDDTVPTYLPAPAVYDGNGGFRNVANFDIRKDSFFSPYISQVHSYDAYGNPINESVDGIHAKQRSLGFEFDKDVGNGFHINNKFKDSKAQGNWVAPFIDGFPNGPASAAIYASALCGAKASSIATAPTCVTAPTVTYAAGPNAGRAYAGMVATDLQFSAQFKDLSFMVNDLKLNWDIGPAFNATAGYYFSRQKVSIDWNSWQVRAVSVERNPVPLNIVAANGAILADSGLTDPSFLNWSWDLTYSVRAPYLALGGAINDFNWDVSVRRDQVRAQGTRYTKCCGIGDDAAVDRNGNGVIDMYETGKWFGITPVTSSIFLSNQTPADRANYTASHTSYSLGGNYRLTEQMSVFGRYSVGANSPADRLYQVGGALRADGSLNPARTDGFDEVKQIELGYKLDLGRTRLFATLFQTKTHETNNEFTSGLTFLRDYKANGLELEGDWRGELGFGVNGNITFTNAKIDHDQLNPAVDGNQARRQAKYIYTITPSYQNDLFNVALTAQGSGKYYLFDTNDLPNSVYQKAYMIFNLNAGVNLSDALLLSASINNLTDKLIATESENPGVATAGSIQRVRVLNGRTTSLSLKYKF